MARLMEIQEAEVLQVTRLQTERMRGVTADNLTLFSFPSFVKCAQLLVGLRGIKVHD